MANIDFPNTPQVDDEFQADGKTYKWDGVKWVFVPALQAAERTVIPSISFVDKTADSITVTFTNNEEEEVDLYYGLSTPPNEENIELNSQATSSNIVFDNLTPGTEYNIYAFAITKPTSKKIKSEIIELQVTTLNQTQAATLSFVSKNEISITLGVLNNDVEAITSLTITGGESTFTESSLNITSETTQNFIIPNLIPNKEYNFIATVQANTRPVSNNSNTITETTTAQTMPTFSNVSSTSNSITFRVKNENSVPTTIRYSLGSDPTSGSAGVSLSPGVTSGNLSFTGLAASTTYSIRARGDLNTNLGPVRSQSVSTQAPPAAWISATGGTTTTYSSGGQTFKSHTFTSSGNFVVNSLSDQPGGNAVDYLIIAGGAGGGGNDICGGGGAGGYRTTLGTSGGNSTAENKITVTAQSYGVTIGAGGTSVSGTAKGNNGANTTVLGITSTGGGGGGFRGGPTSTGTGLSGGSGGGGGGPTAFGDFNPVAISGGSGISGQGTNGGLGFSGGCGNAATGGGGGAGQVGQNGTSFGRCNASNGLGGDGGNGLSNTLRTGSSETRAGGGGGSAYGYGGQGGTGGGGNGNSSGGGSGVINTGSGGGGTSGAGGSGIVIVRYRIG
jgi:hypothetical protein